MNNSQTVSYIKAEAKKIGLTFKAHKRITINGSPAYLFCIRGNGENILESCTLGSALNNLESGYVAGLLK